MVNISDIKNNSLYQQNNVQNSETNSCLKIRSISLSNMQNEKDMFLHSVSNDDISQLKKELIDVQKSQGLIGKTWNGVKKLFGGGSKKVEKAISQLEKGEITLEHAKKILDKYKNGQKMSVDVIADMTSAITAIVAYNTVLPKDKVSIASGFAISTLTGAGVKTGIKSIDAKVGGRKYTKKDFIYDTSTGAMNGFMGPLSNALGAKTTEKIGRKFGLEVISNNVGTGNISGIRGKIADILSAQYTDVKGGTLLKRVIALGTGMAIDGALSGASDNMVRAGLNGDDVLKAGAQGAIAGGIAAPVLGGGFRIAAKAGQRINNKIITSRVLSDGMQTTFKQGKSGDCSLLTILDGIMNNPNAQNKVKDSITKSIGGDYFVKIGDRTVKVAKSVVTDEMLSDVTGIKIFEKAYEQIAGELDGGFADVVAKQFGLNPVHITSDSITDDLLAAISKQKDNTVFALGLNVDDVGNIAASGKNRHYFTIRNIDSNSRIVSVVNPYDTSQVIDLPFEQVTKSAISIDGGTVTKSSLPNAIRHSGEVAFKGINVDKNVRLFADYLKKQEISMEQFEEMLHKVATSSGNKHYSLQDFLAMLELNGVSFDDISQFISHEGAGASTLGELYSVLGKEEASDVIFSLVKELELKQIRGLNKFLEPYNLSITDMKKFMSALNDCDVQKISKILKSSSPEYFEAVGGEAYIEKKLGEMCASFSNSTISSGITTAPEHLIEIPSLSGRRRLFIFNNSTSIPHKAGHRIDYGTLIKSNMITEDAIELAQKSGIRLPETCSSNIQGMSKSVVYKTSALIEKAKKYGYDKLSSFEIHALTDMLDTLYKQDESFSKLLSKNDSLPAICDRIYDIVDYLRTKSVPVLKGTNIEIGDHAFLRMMDRNLATVVENSTGKVLDYADFIKLISENAAEAVKKGKNEFIISGFQGSHGIKVKIKTNGKKIIIDSIM